jgi:hypothetical protein
MRHAAAKYNKFAYSSAFGFSVPLDNAGLRLGAYDSMLALSDDGVFYRPRRETLDVSVEDGVHRSRWHPWEDVEVRTWLVPAGPWHVRVHRVKTSRRLHAAEGGFALPTIDAVADPEATQTEAGATACRITNPCGISGIRALHGYSGSQLVEGGANSNLIAPLTCIPTLEADLEPGNHLLACAVLGRPGPAAVHDAWGQSPVSHLENGALTILDAEGNALATLQV